MTSLRFGVGLAIAIAALWSVVSAQQVRPLPPPPVSLTVPHPIPPVAASPPRDIFQHPSRPPDHGKPGDYNPRRFYGPSVFVPTGYGPILEPQPAPQVNPPSGALRFETIPDAAQVFVDGMYVGVAEDFSSSGRALELDPGRHRVELRAEGYRAAGFDVLIGSNQITRYRGDLEREAPPAPAVRAAAKPIYIIANCYAGDRPPSRPLPKGCSLSQMRVR